MKTNYEHKDMRKLFVVFYNKCAGRLLKVTIEKIKIRSDDLIEGVDISCVHLSLFADI